MISYAQNFEDVMLWRALKNVEKGFYIDVGANDPSVDSVTRRFYENGWRGVNIEPLPHHFHDLSEQRPEDVNLCCAAGSERGQVKIWECDVRGWATASEEVVAQHEKDGHKGSYISVEVRTLSDICEEFSSGDIHFLKVDVEGFECQVLEGMDFGRFRPWLVVIEATRPNSQIAAYEEWESLLTGCGYQFSYADGLNRFYIADEHQDLAFHFCFPPNVFDGFTPVRVAEAEKRAAFEASRANESLVLAQLSESVARQELERRAHAESLMAAESARANRAEQQVLLAEGRALQLEGLFEKTDARLQHELERAIRGEERLVGLQTRLDELNESKLLLDRRMTDLTAAHAEQQSKAYAELERSREGFAAVQLVAARLEERSSTLQTRFDELKESKVLTDLQLADLKAALSDVQAERAAAQAEVVRGEARLQVLQVQFDLLQLSKSQVECDLTAMAAERSALSIAVAEAGAREQGLFNQLSTVSGELMSCMKTIGSLEAQADLREQKFSSELLATQLENDRQSRLVQEMERRLITESKRSEEFELEVSALQNRYQTQKFENDAMEIRLESLSGQVAELDRAMSELRAVIQGKQSEVEYWHERLLQVHASTSWRVTKPIRFLKRKVTTAADILFRRRDEHFSSLTTFHVHNRSFPRMLSYGVRQVFQRPKLRMFISGVLKKVPRAHRWIKSYAMAHGMVPAYVPQVAVSPLPSGGKASAEYAIKQFIVDKSADEYVVGNVARTPLEKYVHSNRICQ